jgi:hypothetical protein
MTLENTVSWFMNIMIMRFEVFTVVTLKVIYFWDVVLCSVVDMHEGHTESHEHPGITNKCQCAIYDD